MEWTKNRKSWEEVYFHYSVMNYLGDGSIALAHGLQNQLMRVVVGFQFDVRRLALKGALVHTVV